MAKVYIMPFLSDPHGVTPGGQRVQILRATLLFNLREAGLSQRDMVRGKQYGWELAREGAA